MTVLLVHTTTPEGEAAREAALAEASRRGSDVVLVPLSGEDPGLDTQGYDVPLAVRLPDGRDRDVVGDLLDIAAEIDAELIVIGMRQRTPVGKLLLGSTAQQILLEASAPVLAVKAPR